MTLYKLVKGMDRDNYYPIVVSLTNGGSLRKKFKALDINVYTLDFSNLFSFIITFISFIKVVLKFKPQIIQGWMYHGNIVATIIWYLTKKYSVLVWNIRQSLYEIENEKPMTFLVIKINRLLSSLPNTIIYNSILSYNHHSIFGIKSINSIVIPNGFDLQNYYYSDKKKREMRFILNIPYESIVIGHVARLHPMKDHSLFLRVAVKYAKSYLNSHFLLIGKDVSMKNKALSSLIPSEIHNRFHLIGEQNNIAELMCIFDLFCQSSWAEAFPNVLGEAMAIGVPCIATNVGDSEIIVGNTGVIVPSRNEKDLYSGIEKILNMPNSQRKILGEKARNRIKSNYELNVIIDKYTKLYGKLISRKKYLCVG